MYVDEEDDAEKEKPDYKDPNNESATLDRAKEAAKEFVQKHPETQVFKKEPEQLRRATIKPKQAVSQKASENKEAKKSQAKKNSTKEEAKEQPKVATKAKR